MWSRLNNSSMLSFREEEQSDLFNDPKSGPIYTILPFMTSVVVGCSSLVAVLGNLLIMAAIWMNQTLRTPFYVLLCGLALTDFFTGLVGESLYIVYKLTYIIIHKKYTIWFCSSHVVQFFGVYFSWVTFLIMTFMSVERWLHMARSSLLTVHRVCGMLFLLMLAPVLISLAALLRRFRQDKCIPNDFEIFTECLAVFCFGVTSFGYFKVFRIIRQHQNQVQANNQAHNFGQSAIDLIKYKKSVYTILYILILFYFCFLPSTCLYLSRGVVEYNFKFLYVASDVSITLVLISSSINPFLYCWRIQDIRNGVKHLIRTKIFFMCKNG